MIVPFAITVVIILMIIYILRVKLWYAFVTVSLKINQKLSYKSKSFTLDNLKKFDDVISISKFNFPSSLRINANKNLINQYTIVDMTKNLDHVTQIVTHQQRWEENIIRLLLATLEHVHLDMKPIDPNNCVIVDLIQSSGQYFPSLHTDVEWETFYKQDGYQIWYLLENDDEVGNMFILDTPKVLPATYLEFEEEDNKVSVLSQDSSKLIQTWDVDDIKYNLKYLDMKRGDCIIFGKNLYHTSDCRMSKYRFALNMRILFKNPDGSINLNPNCVGAYHKMNDFKIYKNNVKRVGNKIYPKMFDLI